MVGRISRAQAAAPPRLVGALLAAVLALTAVACNPTELNNRMTTYANNADNTDLNSGSKGASVVLSNGRVVFLVNDAYVGGLDGDGDRLSSTKIPNALVVGDGLNPDDPPDTLVGAGNTAWLKPQTPGHSFTLLSAVAGGSDIQIFAIERNGSGGTVGFRIIRVLQSNLQISGTPVALAHHSGGPEWGSHVLKNEHDDHWYIYGTGSTSASTYVARAPFGYLTSEPNWQYWTGSSWSAVEAQSGPLRDEAGDVVDQYLTPTFQDLSPTVPDDPDRVVFLGRGGSAGTDFTISAATRPQGPLTVGSPGGYDVPTESCGSGGTVLSSSVSSHPQLSDDSAHAIFSYARRCSVTNTKAAIDRPRFFEIDLNDAPATPRWRATWASGLARTNSFYSYPDGIASAHTLRQVVHTSRGGGSTVRIRVSNAYGTAPLVIDNASIGISTSQNGNTSAVTATPTPVTFGGQPGVRVPVGQSVRSDAITLPATLPSDHDVAVSLYFPDGTSSPSAHLAALETSHVAPGNKAQAVSTGSFGATGTTDNGYFLTGLDVADPASGGTVVTLGDSLTDGLVTSTDGEQRWPNYVHDQLAYAGSPVRHIANMGVAGRTLLPWDQTDPYSATAAFDEEVLAQSGIRTVIIWIGINDLTRYNFGLPTPTATQMGNALEDLVDRGHAAGVRVILATITPMRGPSGGTMPPSEGVRQQVNAMIRGNQLGADAFVDFDAAVRQPADHSRLQAGYSFDNGLHLTPLGYQTVANEVYLKRASL